MTFTSVSQSILRFLFTLLLFFILTAGTDVIQCAGSEAEELFPVFPVLEKNVLFWEKIYSHYSLNEAVIHDSNDLSKIYEVISLLDQDLPGATRLNGLVILDSQKKIAELLKKLSQEDPANEKERKISSLFSGSNKREQMAEAANNVRSQAGQKERFLEGVVRSGSYLTEIKRILKSYRLPEELAYLPHVESSFNPMAYSKFGAAGIWQFTRATGNQYLKIDYVLDERLDPIYSTRAAAKYLKNSHRNLGDWPLALTSYNYGLAGMIRAKQEQGTYINIFQNYQKGYFKFASRNFYAEFLAALKVARQIEKNKKFTATLPNNNVYYILPGFISIDNIARHFNLSPKDIVRRNPALLKPIILGEKLIPEGYSLRLPAQKETSSKIAAIPPSIFQKEQKRSLFHRVQQGDTASSIAKKYKISLKNLMKANNLDKYATIYIKQRLRIPGELSSNSAKADVIAIKARYKEKVPTTKDRLSIPALSPTKKRRPMENDAEFIPKQDPTVYNVFDLKTVNGKKMGYITVQPEETISLYAEWLKSTISTIVSLNAFKSDVPISPGQQLKLPFDNQTPTRFEDHRLDFLQETEEGFFSVYAVVGQKIYHVNDGDTFWDICYNKFDIPLWLLHRYNSSVNLEKLTKNQKLIIPLIKHI